MSAVLLRHARRDDAEAIARLHAESWRVAYRGILTAEFLDGPIFEERLAVWRLRFSGEAFESGLLLLAIEREVVLGFVCVMLDTDAAKGPLLDNLHVLSAAQGRGIGLRLIACAARWVSEQRPGSPMHLWVFEGNLRARDFYDQLGGVVIERRAKEMPDGSRPDALCYSWIDPERLAAVSPDAKCPR